MSTAAWLRENEPILVPVWIRAVKTAWARADQRASTSELRQQFFLTFFDGLVEATEGRTPEPMTSLTRELVPWAVERGVGLPSLLALPLQMMMTIQEHSASEEAPARSRILIESGELLVQAGLQMAVHYGHLQEMQLAARVSQVEDLAQEAARARQWQKQIEPWVQSFRAVLQPEQPWEGLESVWASLVDAMARLPGTRSVGVWVPGEEETLWPAAQAPKTPPWPAVDRADETSGLVRAYCQDSKVLVRSPSEETLFLPLRWGSERAVVSVEISVPEDGGPGREVVMALTEGLVTAAEGALALTVAAKETQDLRKQMEGYLAERTAVLRQANWQLERLARARSDFINIAAHELKTPLTLLRGYTDILREEKVMEGRPDLAPVLQGLERGIERLDRVVANMIDISRIEADLLQLRLEEVSPLSLARLVLEEVRGWVRERGQTITVEGLADLPAIQGDARRLHQALLNIVANSVKFTPDGGRIAIRGRVLGTQGATGTDYVEVVVADTGIGIAREDQEQIFEKFYRGADVRFHSSGDYKFKGGGPGLGLPIARGIIEAHGGRVWVESEGYDEERCPGSEFHIVLPVRATTLHNLPGGPREGAEGKGEAFWQPQ